MTLIVGLPTGIVHRHIFACHLAVRRFISGHGHEENKPHPTDDPDIPLQTDVCRINSDSFAHEIPLTKVNKDTFEWTPVYRYRGFVGVWFVLRLNLVFFIFSLSTLPLSIAQQIPIAPSLGLILWSSIVFAAIKKYYTRIIAAVSVDTPTRSIYRIGYPSIFASRRDRFARVEDVVPLSSNSDSVGGVACLRFTDGPKDDFLLLPTVNVEIRDKKAAFLLFGSALKHFDKDIVPSSADEQQKTRKAKEMLEMERRRQAQIGEKREETPRIGERDKT